MGSGPLCEGCALQKSGAGFTEIEIGSAYERTKLLLVGEASGEAEARESLPFRPYAQSGSLLSDAMREVQISRSEVAITNILRCRPPKDWLTGAPYEFNAISNCTKNYLYSVIEQLKPRAILALGGTAMRALTVSPKGKYGNLDYIRGYVQMGEGPAAGIPVISTYHPAFVRRGAAHLTPLLQRDLRRAFLLATGRLKEGVHFSTRVEDLGLGYQTAPTIDEAWEFAEGIDPDLHLAYDLETPLSTREDEDERVQDFANRDIKLFQCSQHRGSAIAIPFRDEYRDVVRAILDKARHKVGFNCWNFDDPVLRANGIDVGETDDAMVLFGTLWSDLPKNLQAVAQMCGFPFAWKSLSETDLEFYGCADADATLWSFEFLKKQAEEAGAWEAYQRYFRGVFPILRDMSRRGIPISNEKRLELKALIEREDLRVTAAIQEVVPPEVRSNKQKLGLKRTPKSTEGMVQIDVTIEEPEKCCCLKKERGSCAVCAGSGIIASGTVVRRWANPVSFNPNSSQQVKRLIKHLGHPLPKHQKRTNEDGEAADTTEMKELERLYAKTKAPIYPMLIEKRMLTKIDGTYVTGYEPQKDGRLRTTWGYGTATWQLTSKSPCVQNSPARGKTPFQKMLIEAFANMLVASPGCTLVNIDYKSFHAQTTACEAGLPDYLRLAKIDIHSFNACHFIKHPERNGLLKWSDSDLKAFFKELKADKRIWTNGLTFKEIRDNKTKSAGLGIGFGMQPRKLYMMYKEDFENQKEAEAIWNLIMRELFPGLYKWHQEIRQKATEEKKLVSRFGALRHFFDCSRWDRKQQKWVGGDQAEAAIAFLPASNAFGMIRYGMLKMEEAGLLERFRLINTKHDSLKFDCPDELVEECKATIIPIAQSPCPVMVYPGVTGPEGLSVEVEAMLGKSDAELH